MIPTIGQYVEAMSAPDGRWRTLERLHPSVDGTGAPVFSMPGHGLVDLEVVAGGVRHTLRCPLRWDDGAAQRLRTLVRKDRGLGGRFFTEWKLLEREVILFGEDGGAFEVDILARPLPVGISLTDFTEKAVVRGDTAAIEAAERSFEDLAQWARRVGRGGIALRRVIVGADGAVRVTGFSADDETRRIREMLRAAALRQKPAGEESDGAGYGFGEEKIHLVKDGAGWIYADRLGKAVIEGVWMAAEPFRGGRAEVGTAAGKGLIDRDGRAVLEPVYEEVVWDDYWNLAAVMTEGRWSLVDIDGRVLTAGFYDWLGECSEGLLVAQKGDKCGFLDTADREAIPFLYDDATSFSEGCALVSLGAGGRSESFFIDAAGKRI